MSLCEYKDLFGKPNEGSHAYRIPVLDLAAVDVIMTVAVSYGASYYFNYSFLIVLLVFIIAGIVSHKLFCVDTTVNTFIFGKKNNISQY